MPEKELERLSAVNRFLNLAVKWQDGLQEIVESAAYICGTSSALITLLDRDTQHIIFKKEFDYELTERTHAFCDRVVKRGATVVIPDASADSIFSSNPLVTADPHISFYAGVPLTTTDGYLLGSLCVIDSSPGELSAGNERMLKVLAKQAVNLMEFDSSLQVVKQMYIDAKRSEIELRSFFESSVDHHLLLGLDFEVLAFNKSWEKHVKATYGIQMKKGEKMSTYIKVGHLTDFYGDYNRALQGTVTQEERNLSHDGSANWRLVKFEPALNSEGQTIGVSVNVADINTKVEQGLTVAWQNKKLDRIAVMQSHQFRKPVASILGLVALLNIDVRFDGVEELEMIGYAALELDEKIRAIVSSIDDSHKHPA